MADLVELAIVYNTGQAAQRVAQLDDLLVSLQANTDALNNSTKRGTAIQEVSGGSMRGAGRAALVLATSLQTGSMSAAGMAGSLGRVATVLLGPWGIAIGIAIGVLTLFKNNQEKARETAEKFGHQLRDVSRNVDDLFRPTGKTAFESEIDHITDAMDNLNDAINKAHASWLFQIRDFFATHGLHIPGLGVTLFGGGNAPLPEEGQLRRLRRERERLTPEAEGGVLNTRALDDLDRIGSLGQLSRTSESAMLSEKVGVFEDLLKKLWETGFRPGSVEIDKNAESLRQLQDQLRKAQRAEHLVTSGLQTMADALEDFVITGTLAFTDFLNNILRLLYRDFTGELIHGITQSAFSIGGRPSGGGGGGTQVLGNPGGGGGINTNVVAAGPTFNISAHDSQDVARWVGQNGAAIATEIGRQAARNANLRRIMRRG